MGERAGSVHSVPLEAAGTEVAEATSELEGFEDVLRVVVGCVVGTEEFLNID